MKTPRPLAVAGSCKSGFTLVELMIVVVVISLLAAMAIPAFNKVRTSLQNKAVVNNIRLITSAADQYFIEEGLSAVAIVDLIGSDAYIKGVNEASLQVANEDYTDVIERGNNYRVNGLPSGVGGAGVDALDPTNGSTELVVSF